MTDTPVLSFGNAEMATIQVDPNEKPFRAYKALLCQESTFFKAALDGGFTEAADNMVKMPEEDETIVNDFLHWLYLGFSGREIPETAEEVLDDCSAAIDGRMKHIIDHRSSGDFTRRSL
jgi:BTB/POZ domain